MKTIFLLPAKPQPLEIDLRRIALIVVDMQNAFLSRGGMGDKLRGTFNEMASKEAIAQNKKVIEAARNNNVRVIYLRMAYRPDLADVGGPESPNYWKDIASITMRERPEVRGKYITQGSWDAEIVEELKPEAGEIVIDKNRYSGFFNTELHTILSTYSIKYLVFIGVATNVCVESTLRDAFFYEYFPILLSDGCFTHSPPFAQDATIHVVETAFGWVTTCDEFINTLK
jgi:ureidoacrylate peracid hydrolase